MLIHGYNLNSLDLNKLSELIGDYDILFLFEISKRLINKSLIPKLFIHSQVIFIIESAKRNDLIGYKYKTKKWVQLANTAIEYHKEYWVYIQAAFKYYGIWKLVEAEDTKGSFSKKLQSHYLSMPEQNYELDEVVNELYSEIYNTSF